VGGNNIMGLVRSKNNSVWDNKVEAFCHSSAQLLESIYTKHGRLVNEIPDKKEKKKKIKK